MRAKLQELYGEEHTFTSSVFSVGTSKPWFLLDGAKSIQYLLFSEPMIEDGTIVAHHLWVKANPALMKMRFCRGDVIICRARVESYLKGSGVLDYTLVDIHHVERVRAPVAEYVG